MLYRFFAIALLTLLFAGEAAYADTTTEDTKPTVSANGYAVPSWPDLLRTMVRFNALDLSDPKLLDEYSIVTECDLYKTFYSDDFKWNKVRTVVFDDVKKKVATFPMNYQYDVKLQLDRYDFQTKTFQLSDKTSLSNVNSFVLYSVVGTGCGTADAKLIPRLFRAVIDQPIYVQGLPLAEKDAKAVLDKMNADGNSDRIVYTRFNLRIIYVDPLRKTTREDGTSFYQQSNSQQPEWVRLDARLKSIEFFEDPEMQLMIYRFDL